MVRLAPGPAAIIDEVPAGRLYKDGDIVIGAADRAVPERRKLAFAGIVSVAIAIDERGEIAGDPVIEIDGPARQDAATASSIADFVADAVGDVSTGCREGERRDPDAVETAVRAGDPRHRASGVWGKKPACHVLVVEV